MKEEHPAFTVLVPIENWWNRLEQSGALGPQLKKRKLNGNPFPFGFDSLSPPFFMDFPIYFSMIVLCWWNTVQIKERMQKKKDGHCTSQFLDYLCKVFRLIPNSEEQTKTAKENSLNEQVFVLNDDAKTQV